MQWLMLMTGLGVRVLGRQLLMMLMMAVNPFID